MSLTAGLLHYNFLFFILWPYLFIYFILILFSQFFSSFLIFWIWVALSCKPFSSIFLNSFIVDCECLYKIYTSVYFQWLKKTIHIYVIFIYLFFKHELFFIWIISLNFSSICQYDYKLLRLVIKWKCHIEI